VLSLRVTRDKRGYEHIYLIADSRRRGRADSRLVYWCRMPGGLRVGREPFDSETRDALERGNPDLTFDWPALTKTLSQSLAAARWAARQERPGGGAPAAKSGPRRGPARGDGRSDGRGNRQGQGQGTGGGRDRRGGETGRREPSDD
jgi:hypothetical protein